jgi:hypothetical protein
VDSSSQVVEIPLTHGQVALIDACDYPLVSLYRWRARRRSLKATWYALAETKTIPPGSPPIYMHRLILGAKKGEEVDHIDWNGLNNRRFNLRLCSPKQNAAHTHFGHGKSSQYKCVRWNPRWEKWQAYKFCDGKWQTLGFFTDEVDAALAYDQYAFTRAGKFATLNFPGVRDTSRWVELPLFLQRMPDGR